MYYSVYVGQLPIKTTKEDLLELFAVHGAKEAVVMKRNGCESSAYGFVRFRKAQAAIDVVKEGEWTLQGKVIIVDVASETKNIMRNFLTFTRPSSKAVERDNMVRSKVKESCRQVNKELDIINGDVPLDARWVINQMENCAVRYAAKLSGNPQSASLLSHQDLYRYLEQRPCRSSKEPEREEGRAGRVMEGVKTMMSGLHSFLELAQVWEEELEVEALSLLGKEELLKCLPPRKRFLPRNVEFLMQTLGMPYMDNGEEIPGVDQKGDRKQTVSENGGGFSAIPSLSASSSDVVVADRKRTDLPEHLERLLQLSVMARVERKLYFEHDGQPPSSTSLDKLKAFGGGVSSPEGPSSTEPGGKPGRRETFSLEKPVPADPPGVTFSRESCHSQQQQTSGGKGKSGKNFEQSRVLTPNSGKRRSYKSFEQSPVLTPRSGKGRSDKNFEPKSGTGMSVENFEPSRVLNARSVRGSSDKNFELSRVLSKISLVQPHMGTTLRNLDDGPEMSQSVSSLSLLQAQGLASRPFQSNDSDPGRKKRGIFTTEKTVNGGAPFRNCHSHNVMAGNGRERRFLELVGGKKGVKGPRFRLRLTKEEEEEREDSRQRWEEPELSYVVPDKCKVALESEDATAQSLQDKEDIWEELGKANFRFLVRGGGMDEEEEVTDSYGRRTTSRRASRTSSSSCCHTLAGEVWHHSQTLHGAGEDTGKSSLAEENGRRTMELGSSRPNGAVSSFRELELLGRSGERTLHHFSDSKIRSLDSKVHVPPKGVSSPSALPVMGRGRGLVYSALMDNLQHNLAPSPRAPEGRHREGQKSPMMHDGGQSADDSRATTPGLGRGRGRGLSLLVSPS